MTNNRTKPFEAARSAGVGALAFCLLVVLPAVATSVWGQGRVEWARGGSLEAGTFLVARPDLPDPNFYETVVLLLSYHEAGGAVGVVVNRRARVTVQEAVTESEMLASREDDLYLGGPVDVETMIVLLRGESPPEGSLNILGDVFLVHDGGLDSLLESSPSSASVRFYAGYAGWSPGQLEDEISRGVWNLLNGDPAWVFTEHPDEAWETLTRIVLGPRA